MIQKRMYLKTSDKTNINWLMVIHLYKGFNRKTSQDGFFVKNSAKKVKPPKIEYRGFKRKVFKKGDVIRSLIVKTCFNRGNRGFSYKHFYKNSSIIIRKKNLTKSKYFFGLVSKNILRKKFLVLFNRSF